MVVSRRTKSPVAPSNCFHLENERGASALQPKKRATLAVGIRKPATLLAMAACLGAAVSYGFAAVYSRRFSARGVAPAGVAFGQVAASTLIAAPLAFGLEGGFHAAGVAARAIALSPEAVAAALALALVSTAFAYAIFFRILAGGGATYVSLVTLLVPATAVLIGALVLGERLGGPEALGFALIAAGLIAVDGGKVFRRTTAEAKR